MFLGFSILICFLLFNQWGDISITVQQALSMFGAVRQGQFFHYYEYVYNAAHQSLYSAPGMPLDFNVASYSIFLYGLIAFWNLPLKLVDKFIIDVQLPTYIYWSKFLILIFLLMSTLVLFHIGKVLGMTTNKARWMSYFFLSSPITLFAVIVFGQFDIICIFFTLLAMYFYFEKKYYKFAFAFALAIPFKFYIVFILIPLILLFEKRIFHIIKLVLISSWSTILERLLVINDPYYKISKDFIYKSYGFMERIYQFGINMQNGPVFILGIVLVVACIFAYRQKYDKSIISPFSYYIPFIINASLIFFIYWHPQWMILLIPFIVINTFMNPDFKLSVYLQYFMLLFYFCVTFMIFINNVDQSMVNNGILPLITGKTLPVDSLIFRSFLENFNLPVGVYNTMFIGCGFGFAYLFKPRLTNQQNDSIQSFDFDRRAIWANMSLIYLFIIPTLFAYFTQMT